MAFRELGPFRRLKGNLFSVVLVPGAGREPHTRNCHQVGHGNSGARTHSGLSDTTGPGLGHRGDTGMGIKRALGAGCRAGQCLSILGVLPHLHHCSYGWDKQLEPTNVSCWEQGPTQKGGEAQWAARQFARVPGQPTLTDGHANSRRDAPGRGALPWGLAGAGAPFPPPYKMLPGN